MTAPASLLLTALLAIGLGDITEGLEQVDDILGSDELQETMELVQAFRTARDEITDVEEYYIGRSVAAHLLTGSSPLANDTLQAYVDLVGSAVSRFSSRPSVYGGYHFVVLDSGDLNAMSCPGGLVFVCRGLLDMADSEDELAAILAHEVAHVALSHGLGSIERSRWTEFTTLLAESAVDRWGSDQAREMLEDYGEGIDEVVTTLSTRGYSRSTEYQADSAAVCILAAAGYDPGALSRVLEAMSTVTERSGPGFWQTHPSPEDRLDSVSGLLAGLPQTSEDPARTARFQAAMSAGSAPSGGSTGRGSSAGGRSSGETGDSGSGQSSGGRGAPDTGGGATSSPDEGGTGGGRPR